ncbi:MAG: DUF3800 domain-containing protein [bacterium]
MLRGKSFLRKAVLKEGSTLCGQGVYTLATAIFMKILYLDESGCTGKLLRNHQSAATPVFIISGLIIDTASLTMLVWDLIGLKKRFFPKRFLPLNHDLEIIREEIKGSDLRKLIRTGDTRKKKVALGFMDGVLRILEKHNVLLIGKCLAKQPELEIDSHALYTSYVQALCAVFSRLLEEYDDDGLVMLDSRRKQVNGIVAHSIFTQMYSTRGSRLPRLQEIPVFGHANVHPGLQLADLVCSAMLFPMVGLYSFGTGSPSVHLSAEYSGILTRFAGRIDRILFRYRSDTGAVRSSLQIDDRFNGRKYFAFS